MEPLLVSVVEAAQACGISRSAMYELLAERKISSMKIGKSRLVEVASIKAFVASLPTDDVPKLNRKDVVS
ncbi:DNA-binding protein, excisionase family [Terriglobus roseus DSM 18391]|uniref:DNA-binding protein, excisionase family n=1 Tax=Terriglobus roseus (strain DSM 18391 / NRRL B-41598 / KBS 63) TaxID=926566 RepID=I3ZDZ3_TERRK|nr:DNA-binding protein, excisionase family [Terriglobus roseus DSM 18391]